MARILLYLLILALIAGLPLYFHSREIRQSYTELEDAERGLTESRAQLQRVLLAINAENPELSQRIRQANPRDHGSQVAYLYGDFVAETQERLYPEIASRRAQTLLEELAEVERVRFTYHLECIGKRAHYNSLTSNRLYRSLAAWHGLPANVPEWL